MRPKSGVLVATLIVTSFGGAKVRADSSWDSVEALFREVGDMQLMKEWNQSKAAPSTSHNFVNRGNLIVRGMEAHIARYAAFTAAGASWYKHAVALALPQFEYAIQLNDHFGAHYSLGLLFKLYPGFISDVGALEETAAHGYEHMCSAVDSFSTVLGKVYNETCASIRVLHSSSAIVYSADTAQIRSSISEIVQHESKQGYGIMLLRLGGAHSVFIQGRDFVMHDLHVRGSADRVCHVLLTSSGCYMPLFRQFRARTPMTRELPLAASILQFSGAEYYHWLLESLPRLLLLRQELIRLGLPAMPLLVPRSPNLYIIHTLELLMDTVNSPWPFNDIIPVAADEVTAVRELWYLDWSKTGDIRDGQSISSSQLWAPPAALCLVRSTFVPSVPAADEDELSVVFVTRAPSESRSIVNQDDMIAALQDVCQRHDASLTVFDGRAQGFRGVIRVFSRARVVLGVHGAGLANAVFSPAGASLIEVAMPEPEFREYEHLAHAMGLRYVPLHGLIPLGSFEAKIVLQDVKKVAKAVATELLIHHRLLARQECDVGAPEWQGSSPLCRDAMEL